MQWIVSAAVIIVHGIVLWILTEAETGAPRQTVPADLYVTILPLVRQRHALEMPLPEVHLSIPAIDSTAIGFVSFIDPNADLVPGITAPKSAPRLDSVVSVDSRPYAVRAGLAAGEAVTVVLEIEVLADGSVGQVTVVSGSGNSAIDQEAVNYAHALQWIPGTVERRARVMRINYAVTLALPA